MDRANPRRGAAGLLRALLFVAALALSSCGRPADLAGSGAVEACGAGDLSGRCQLRQLVSDVLASYAAGAPQSVEAEYVWRMRSHEEEIAQLDLIGGENYLLIGACDTECLDIDLFLRDADGQQAINADGQPLMDTELDRVPVIQFTPPADGTYQLALSMFNCLIEPCYAGVRIMRLVLNPSAEARFTRQLRSGFDDPASFVFDAGGDRIWTSTVQGSCAGHFNAAPDVSLEYVRGDTPFPLIISAGPADAATSPLDPGHDTTLMVYQFEQGAWLCDDDSGAGVNPSLTIDAPNGRYAIWVGSFLSDARPRTRLFVSEHISQ